MGSWNETCGISGLPIEWGDKTVAFILKKIPMRRRSLGLIYFIPLLGMSHVLLLLEENIIVMVGLKI